MPQPTAFSSSNLEYVGSEGTVSLDGPLVYVGTGLSVRKRSWTYSLGRHNVSGQVLQSYEAEVEASFLSLEEADRSRYVFDTDLADGTPGKLVSNGWTQRAYVVGSTPSLRYHDYLKTTLKVVLLDGTWHREETVSFSPSTNVSDYGKIYSFGYEYDYAPASPARTVDVPGSSPNPFRFVIWGRAVNPSVTIAGNLYSFNVTVPAGGYLLVDTLDEPIVKIVTADGITSDAFDSAHRGGGLGSGDYAFEPIPDGTQLVSWDDSFGFDLTIYHVESEIPWTS